MIEIPTYLVIIFGLLFFMLGAHNLMLIEMRNAFRKQWKEEKEKRIQAEKRGDEYFEELVDLLNSTQELGDEN